MKTKNCTLPPHFMIASDGDLCDTRKPHYPVIRAKYSCTSSRIETCAQFKAALRAGEFAWPGGYQLYLITSDGEALSFKGARENARNILDSIRNASGDGWRVVACEINYEDKELYCCHTGERILSSYCED